MPRIQCPSCDAVYDLPADAMGPDGRKVRCAACKTLWLARIDAPAPTPEVAILPQVESAPLQQAKPWYDRVGSAERARRRPTGQRVAIALALVVGLGGAIVLRKPIVAAVPETGVAYAALGLPVNLRGLDLRAVQSSVTSEGGTEMLVVEGEIVNLTTGKKALPRLHFSVRDPRGLTLYTWTAQADARDLMPGQSLPFRRRLASPPGEGQSVLVRFANQADLLAAAP